MKPQTVLMGTILSLSIMLASCSKTNPTEPQNKVLTDDVKTKLEAAADKVFLGVDSPGMIALFSAEGEEDFIIKRGVSNTQTGEPMNENQYFRIASNTKTFTCTAILRLADEGKISLDSTISYYLPENNIPGGDKITLRMLGNMTSGLFNYTQDSGFQVMLKANNYLKTFAPDSLLAMAFRNPISFEPGTDYEYSNTNTILLGLLIEKVTGNSVGNVIQEKVLTPLNLKHTHWPTTVFLPSDYCHGYNSGSNKITDVTNCSPSMAYAAGAMISTVPDVKIWVKALAEGQLLSAKMKAERFNWVKDHYGFGVMKVNNWIGHSGSIPGFNSHLFYNPVTKITFVVYVNMDSGSPVEYYSYFFRDILDNPTQKSVSKSLTSSFSF